LNQLPAREAREAFFACCGCHVWAEALANARPFGDEEELFEKAETLWEETPDVDRREVFDHHPRIGDVESLRKRFAGSWAGGEQAGVTGASERTLKALLEGNRRYEMKMGFLFLVCATGKGAEEMLSLLDTRLKNDRAEELVIALGEQAKITRLRLGKLLQS
jgi:2-oxo-4-hydroxy-4-carboxy-5-ureidoimidazoline decarboxylase